MRLEWRPLLCRVSNLRTAATVDDERVESITQSEHQPRNHVHYIDMHALPNTEAVKPGGANTTSVVEVASFYPCCVEPEWPRQPSCMWHPVQKI